MLRGAVHRATGARSRGCGTRYAVSAPRKWGIGRRQGGDPTTTRLRWIVCHAKDYGGKKFTQEEVESLAEALKKGGVDKDTAKKIMESWKELGDEANVTQLRKLFFQQSLVPVGVILVQALLDAGASYGSFTAGSYFGLGPPSPFQGILVALGYIIGGYFAAGVVLDIVTLGAVLIAGNQFGANTELFMAAVKQVAGPTSGLSVADKAQTTFNSLKVVSTLNGIAELIKVASSKPTSSSIDTLRDLSTYLTLYNAEKKYGFDAAKFGASSKQAEQFAALFGKYDNDEDGRLNFSEFTALCQDATVNAGEAEVKEALRLLDTDKDGYLELNELVDWYLNKKDEVAAAAAAPPPPPPAEAAPAGAEAKE